MYKLTLVLLTLCLSGLTANAGPIRNWLNGGTPVRDFIKNRSFRITVCPEALPQNFVPAQSVPQRMPEWTQTRSDAAPVVSVVQAINFEWSMEPVCVNGRCNN